MKTILLIEDDAVTGKVYQCRLQLEGFRVELARDGVLGWEALSKETPTLIVLDWILPKLNGRELLGRIRNNPTTQSVPVIVFTNDFYQQSSGEALDAGATRVIIKSRTTPKQLIGVIQEILNGSNAGQIASKAGEKSSPSPETPAAPESEAPTVEDAKRAIAEHASTFLGNMKNESMRLLQARPDEDRGAILEQLFQLSHSYASISAAANAFCAARVASALEALVRELQEKPKNITPSSVRTISQTIQYLNLLGSDAKANESLSTDPAIVVVDDEAISLRAVTNALERAKFKPVAFDAPAKVLEYLKGNKCDLLVTDLHMPGMSGFELAKAMRNMPAHRNTRVILITALDDFKNRIQSASAGVSEFIAKPFLSVELAVKTLTLLIQASRPPAAAPKVFQSLVH